MFEWVDIRFGAAAMMGFVRCRSSNLVNISNQISMKCSVCIDLPYLPWKRSLANAAMAASPHKCSFAAKIGMILASTLGYPTNTERCSQYGHSWTGVIVQPSSRVWRASTRVATTTTTTERKWVEKVERATIDDRQYSTVSTMEESTA